MVTIVSHDKIGIVRHRDGSEVVAWTDMPVMNGRVRVLRERLVLKRLAVDVHDLVSNLNGIPWQSDDALDEILVLVFGKSKDDDVAALNRAEWNDGP